MAARNLLLAAPPYEVELALKTLGANIRTARLRRNLSIAQVAAKIGVERHVIGDAERGKPSTGIVVYAALLWAMGMADQLGRVADPLRDEEGLTLAKVKGRAKAGGRKVLDNDF
ncbi:helix-turn-helix transcriptional regulator [Azorhizobium sp. AG788]|uniref:helix-turn-helix transcriptional regulator n=1 Tax=Azorhizobium sp. AG788 TaxID=2183897 RepID=UPI003138683F